MKRSFTHFLGFRHILTPSGKVIRKLRLSDKKRLRRHLKTLKKLNDKGVVDDNYVQMRKNAFYNHVSKSNENYFRMRLKEEQ